MHLSATIHVYEYDGGPTHSYERAYGTTEQAFLADLERAYKQCDDYARVIARVEYRFSLADGEIIESTPRTREEALAQIRELAALGFDGWQVKRMTEEEDGYVECPECHGTGMRFFWDANSLYQSVTCETCAGWCRIMPSPEVFTPRTYTLHADEIDWLGALASTLGQYRAALAAAEDGNALELAHDLADRLESDIAALTILLAPAPKGGTDR